MTTEFVWETSKQLARLRYLFRWARLNGVRMPTGQDYVIHAVTGHYVNKSGNKTGQLPSPIVATYALGNELWILGPPEMTKAAAVEATLEIRYRERGSLWASPTLNDALEQAIKRSKRDDVKKCADLVMVGPPSAEEPLRWMKVAASLFNVSQEVIIGISGATLFFFKCDEEEALRRLTSLNEAVRVATPRKVLIKMVALRLKNVQDEVAQVNRSRAYQREHDAKQATLKPGDQGHQPNYRPQGQPDIVMPEMNTMEAVRSKAQLLSKEGNAWILDKSIKELIAVLEKDNMDDSVVAEAWNHVVVRMVLES